MKSLNPQTGITSVLALLLAVVLIATACGSDDSVVDTGAAAEPTATADVNDTDETGDTNEEEGTVTEEATPTESIERFWVGAELVDCVGVAPQKCMLVKRSADGQAEYFYDQIEGFTHEVGTTYVIDVAVSEIDNPPADASSVRYRLVEIVEESNEPATAGLDGTTWTLLGFRDGDLFDPVTADVEITINFDGEQVNGSAGCNNYMGTFSADGDALTFGPLASTKKLCPPEIMAFEDRFLPLLGTVETAQITFDGTLVLAPATGMTLVFG